MWLKLDRFPPTFQYHRPFCSDVVYFQLPQDNKARKPCVWSDFRSTNLFTIKVTKSRLGGKQLYLHSLDNDDGSII